MSARIDAIAARVKAATPEPWKWNTNGVVTADHCGKIVCCIDVGFARIPDGEDWDFLEGAREDIPFLLAELSAATARMEKMEEALQGTLSLIRKAQERLCSYLRPDGSDDLTELTNDLLYMCDGPEQRAIELSARAALSPPTKPHGETE